MRSPRKRQFRVWGDQLINICVGDPLCDSEDFWKDKWVEDISATRMPKNSKGYRENYKKVVENMAYAISPNSQIRYIAKYGYEKLLERILLESYEKTKGQYLADKDFKKIKNNIYLFLNYHRSNYGFTDLIKTIAAKYGHVDLVERMLVVEPNRNGLALSNAVKRQNKYHDNDDIVKLLLNHAIPEEGLMAAVALNDPELAIEKINQGAKNIEEAFVFAAKKDNLTMVSLLLDLGARNYKQALQALKPTSNPEIRELLIHTRFGKTKL